MRVRLTHDLWITHASDGTFELGPPLVTRQDTGEGTPRSVVPRPVVFKASTRLDVTVVPAMTVERSRESCPGCAAFEAVKRGEVVYDPLVVYSHNHAP